MSGKVPARVFMKNLYRRILITPQNVGDNAPCEVINEVSQMPKHQECAHCK